MQNQQQKKLNIKLDEQVSEGIYSNFSGITANPSEVIIDFGRITPGAPSGKIYARIIMSPQNSKKLLQLLQQNIEMFEKKFGEIKIAGNNEEQEIGFKTTKG